VKKKGKSTSKQKLKENKKNHEKKKGRELLK
jgi:hypothetical protein